MRIFSNKVKPKDSIQAQALVLGLLRELNADARLRALVSEEAWVFQGFVVFVTFVSDNIAINGLRFFQLLLRLHVDIFNLEAIRQIAVMDKQPRL